MGESAQHFPTRGAELEGARQAARVGWVSLCGLDLKSRNVLFRPECKKGVLRGKGCGGRAKRKLARSRRGLLTNDVVVWEKTEHVPHHRSPEDNTLILYSCLIT